MSPDLTTTLNWLLTHSWQAGVLVLLVLLVQLIFRRHLTNRWRFALWWIVLLRLLVPVSPESAVSVFNFFHPSVHLPAPSQITPAVATQPSSDNFDQSSRPADFPPADMVSEAPDQGLPTAAPIPDSVKAPAPPIEWRRWLIPGLAALWSAGVLALIGAVGLQFSRFKRKLARGTSPAGASLCELLEECRCEFHNTRPIELLETDAVQSPALFGLFQLRLLLPRGIGEQFGRSELRYIFLHELAHVKRGDLWLNWLVTGLLILHWFNPLLWLGFARLRADRELACDELALLRAGDQAGTAYGETVVKLLEHLNRPAAIPGLLGILEDGRQMRRRILMIAIFAQHNWDYKLRETKTGFHASPTALVADQGDSQATPSTGAADSDATISTNASLPKLTNDSHVSGIVLRPDGVLETNARVALQIEGYPIRIENEVKTIEGKTAIGDRDFGGASNVNTWPSGKFILPLEKYAESVAAMSPAGYAQVPIKQLQSLPQITLQKWGRVEGVLREGHRLGTNEIVVLSPMGYWWSTIRIPTIPEPPRGFLTTTDDKGRFVFPLVPPGKHILSRRTIRYRAHTLHSDTTVATDTQIAILDVAPGATIVTNVGGAFRAVTFKLKIDGYPAPVITNCVFFFTPFTPPITNCFMRLTHLKTEAERQAYVKSQEFQTMRYKDVTLDAYLRSDGSFGAEDVPPGSYKATLFILNDVDRSHPHNPSSRPDAFYSTQELIVPPAKDEQDNSAFDLGTLEMAEQELPMPVHATNTPTARQTSNAIPNDHLADPAMAISTNAAPDTETAPVLKGIVFNPDGTPAVNAQVAMLRKSRGVWLAHGGLGYHWTAGSEPALTGPDGRFELAKYDDSKSVVAASKEGYAQVSLEQLSQSPQINLQKWGRIEGVLSIGPDLGKHQTVVLEPLQSRWRFWNIPNMPQPPYYDPGSFETTTDDKGRFTFISVPPGQQILTWRAAKFHPNADLAVVNVIPGATLVTNVGGMDRTVIGKLRLGGWSDAAMTNGIIEIISSKIDPEVRLLQSKTVQEREAFSKTEAFEAQMRNVRNISAETHPDDTFRAEEVPPGLYKLHLIVPHFYDTVNLSNPSNHVDEFDSTREWVVPAFQDGKDDAIVDLGEIDMEKLVRVAPARLEY